MPATSALTLQFLDWIAVRPRTYAEAIDAWRTSCPRLSIWEDALADGLVAYDGGRPRLVVLTSRGRALLDAGPLRTGPRAQPASPTPAD